MTAEGNEVIGLRECFLRMTVWQNKAKNANNFKRAPDKSLVPKKP
jgi:hypothetical protein